MKTRLISAIVMIMLFIPILLLGDIYYVVFSSIVGLMGLWELLRLEKKIPSYMKLLSYFICLFLILYNYNSLDYFNIINFPIVVGIFLIYSLSIIINGDLSNYNYKDSIYLMSCVIIIGLLFNGFIKLRMINILFVIYSFTISITTDTFAYIGGRLFGKHKLSPSISPNKTVEGSIIGSVMGTIVSSIFYYFIIGKLDILLIILMGFILSILSQVGDLFFSSIKRYYKVKDYSNLIPGHGGILDRLDSILFVILGFLMYSLYV